MNKNKKTKSNKSLMIVILVIVVGMILAPVIGSQINRFRLAGAEVDWLPNAGTTIISNEAMVSILDDDSEVGFFVYVGMASCPACQRFEPILDETLQTLNLGLRHLQMEDMRNEDPDEAQVIISRVQQLANLRGWGGGVPVIMYFVQGNVLDILEGVRTQEEITNFFERNGGLN